MKQALLLVDIQNDYFPGGSLALPGSVAASEKARDVLRIFRKNNRPVIHIQHLNVQKSKNYFIPETHGAKIHENVKPADSEIVIRKKYPNSFRETQLLEILNKLDVKKLYIAGMMTQMCIHAAVRAAYDYGFECVVIGDACAAKELEFEGKKIPPEIVHGAFLSAIDGIYADIINASDIIDKDLIL